LQEIVALVPNVGVESGQSGAGIGLDSSTVTCMSTLRTRERNHVGMDRYGREGAVE
jgi:hypothetical protein